MRVRIDMEQLKRSVALFARLLSLGLRTSWGTFVWIAALTLVLGLAPTFTSWVSKGLADGTLGFLQDPQSSAAFRLFVTFLMLIALARTFSGLFQGLSAHLRFRLGKRLSVAMEDTLIAKQLSFPIEVYDDPDYLDKEARTRGTAQTLPSQLLANILDILENAVTLFGSLVLLASVSWILPLLGVASALISMVISSKTARNRYDMIRDRTPRVRRESYLRSLLGGKHNMVYNLLFQLPFFFKQEHARHRDITTKEDIAQSRFSMLMRALSTASAVLFYLGAYGVAVYVVLRSGGTYGEVVMCTMLYGQTESSLQRIGLGLVSFYEQRLYMEDLYAVLDSDVTRRWGVASAALPQEVETLSLENVSFKYPGCEDYVLSEVSLVLNRDEITCMVGLNGAGKTTIVNLLTRMYCPTEGRILLNGTDLNDFKEEELYRVFGVVTQILPSYYYSLRENVCFGDLVRPDGDDEHFRTSCEEFGLDRIAAALPQGYDTLLGRTFYGGEELSYGQWKAIALARVAYKAAPIRIYDEPTAGLDPLAEQRLIEQIMRHREAHITLIVSHCMTVAKDADQILVVRDGRIVERGSHSELMKTAGAYSQMYSTQANRYALERREE
ncbi:MAG: ABC transporter ATP-binding protein [Candidatus Hydrogenedentes bacterium]|nr:ABC transporter ATP-binding protein [Candidatus Hydrogenedentota bacterium]